MPLSNITIRGFAVQEKNLRPSGGLRYYPLKFLYKFRLCIGHVCNFAGLSYGKKMGSKFQGSKLQVPCSNHKPNLLFGSAMSGDMAKVK
jgi:hypothetical protein